MLRFFTACGVLALAISAAPAEDKKPAEEFKDLIASTKSALSKGKTEKEKIKILRDYIPKFIAFAEKHPKAPQGEQALQVVDSIVGQMAMAESDEAFAFLKDLLKSTNQKVKVAALKAVIGNREMALVNADAKKAAELRKEIDEYRKKIDTDFKGEVKDLFVGAKMPELAGKTLDGKSAKLSDYKGKVVVVDIWATWCPPCKAMIPHSRKLVKEMKGKPFVLLGISVDEEKSTLTDFMKDHEMPWTHWWDGQNGPIAKQLGVEFFPTIYVIDHKGTIRFRHLREEALDKAVEKLVKEAEAEKKSK